MSTTNSNGNDGTDLLATMTITKVEPRKVGGSWVTGTIGGHAFEALVFQDHASEPSYELGDSRISKFWLRDNASRATVAEFERGWALRPTTPGPPGLSTSSLRASRRPCSATNRKPTGEPPMRITELHLEGPSQHFAVVRRKRDSAYLDVEIITPGGTIKHAVAADDREDLWSMAQCLQATLDGQRGAGGDVRAYFAPLELMSDI